MAFSLDRTIVFSFTAFFLLLNQVTAFNDSQLHIAQCRAQCLNRFTPVNWVPNNKQCIKIPDCFMCWDTCELLKENFVVWGEMCRASNICYPGCQQSCGFYLKEKIPEITANKKFNQLSFLNSIEIIARTKTVLLSWGRPIGEKEKQNLAYIVLQRRQHSKKWHQLTQTAERSYEIDNDMLISSKWIDFKIIAVTENGQMGQIMTPYLNPNANMMLHDEKQAGEVSISEYNYENFQTELETNKQNKLAESNSQASPLFKPTLLFLRSNNKLGSVDAVVGWPSSINPTVKGNFLVTWQVEDGTFDITGHLYTDSTTVTLSLWPNTVYSVQIETTVADQKIKSQPLIINTKEIYMQSNDINVLITPLKECTNTVVISSVAVAVSCIVFIFAIFIWVRQCKQNKPSKPSNLFHQNLKPFGAGQEIVAPKAFDLEGQITSTVNIPSPTPSSKLENKLSIFGGHINESFPDRSDNRFQYGQFSMNKLQAVAENKNEFDNVFIANLPTENNLIKPKCFRSFSTTM
ncbi:hypothetical protein CHUAL_008410 [Chamberlinius hualienensis]